MWVAICRCTFLAVFVAWLWFVAGMLYQYGTIVFREGIRQAEAKKKAEVAAEAEKANWDAWRQKNSSRAEIDRLFAGEKAKGK
jgi:hypothetical protein